MNAPQKAIRVLVIDDHDVVRAGLISLFSREPDIQVVGDAATGDEGLDLIPELKPDVVVLDFRLPDMSGEDFCIELANRRARASVLVLSGFLDEEVAQSCFLAGARGYVVKDVEASELRRAVRAVAGGDTYVDTKVVGRLVGWAARLEGRDWNSLRPLEIEILSLVGTGRTNAEIAEILNLSHHTIGSRLGQIFRKLGVGQRAEAVAVAIRRGLISSKLPEFRRPFERVSPSGQSAGRDRGGPDGRPAARPD